MKSTGVRLQTEFLPQSLTVFTILLIEGFLTAVQPSVLSVADIFLDPHVVFSAAFCLNFSII